MRRWLLADKKTDASMILILLDCSLTPNQDQFQPVRARVQLPDLIKMKAKMVTKVNGTGSASQDMLGAIRLVQPLLGTALSVPASAQETTSKG